jgi:transposase
MGLDVHKNSYHVALLRSDGASHTLVSPADPQRLLHTLREHGIAVRLAVYEAGPTGFSLARALAAAGIEVIVAAPSRIPRPVTAGAKTDRLDCLKLARYAARGMLKPIAVPTEEEEGRRSLVRRRHELTDSVRRVKQRIRSHLLYLGVPEPKGVSSWSRQAVAALKAASLDGEAKLTLDSLLRELAWLMEERTAVEKAVARSVRSTERQQVMRCLQSVPGVGPTVAATFATELYRPERFTRAEEVTSYLGLAPMVRHSGEGKARGRLCPVGQKRLRSLLVEAAWVWRAKDPGADAIYRRLLGRSGLPQKAISALARRLAVVLWRISLERREYRPVAHAA